MKASFLIVDRNRQIAEETRRCLLARGHDVVMARNGIECIEQLRDAVPMVLVLDPEILWGGGAGVLEWLCEDEPLTPPTVVIANGHGVCLVPDRLQATIDARIERPNSLQDLPRYVNELETLAWWTGGAPPSAKGGAPRHASLAAK